MHTKKYLEEVKSIKTEKTTIVLIILWYSIIMITDMPSLFADFFNSKFTYSN